MGKLVFVALTRALRKRLAVIAHIPLEPKLKRVFTLKKILVDSNLFSVQ